MRLRPGDRIAHFDRTAASYDRDFADDCTIQHRVALDELRRHPARRMAAVPALAGAPGTGTLVDQPLTVLDIGCGTGLLLDSLLSQLPGARPVGIDPSIEMVRHTRRRLPGACVIQAAAENIPLPDASVDVIVSTSSYGHWEHQELGLRECLRLLRTGGVLVLVEHRRAPVWQRLVYRLPDMPAPQETALRLKQAGFGPVSERLHGGELVVAVGRRDR